VRRFFLRFSTRFALFVLVVCVGAGTLCSTADAQRLPITAGGPRSSPDTPLDDVLRSIGGDKVPADYTIIVDTSRSMQDGKLYARVQRALDPFLTALEPHDQLSLLTFDTAPTVRYTGAVGSDVGRVLAQLPATATGLGTDIGSGLDAGLAELERPDARLFGTVVLITDGKHRPPAGSAYPEASGPSWAALRTRAGALAKRHALRAYALALTLDTDAALMKTVFADTTVVAVPPEQIASYLGRLPAELRRAKATQLIRTDLGRRVTAGWTGEQAALDLAAGSAPTTLRLASGFSRIPIELTDLHVVSSGGLAARVTGLPARVALRPGEVRDIPVRLEFQTAGGFGFGRRALVREGQVTLAATVTSPWRHALTSDLGLPFDPRLSAGTANLTGRGAIGWTWTGLALYPAGLLALILLLTVWRRSRQPRLVGAVELWHQGQLATELPAGGRLLRLGRGQWQVPGQALSGTVRAARRRDEHDGSLEPGVSVKANSGGVQRRGTLFNGDSLDVGPITITYVR
jgi:Mg-chelatase subunit ChlD